MPGVSEEDNKRYLEFLEYCLERRQEVKRSRGEDEARKAEALRKEEAWQLMRTSLEFLRSNEDKWRCRRIDECERIKEEDRKDRLAIAKEKKKRYGLKRLSKEENKRLKSRTEERIKIARAKENYWKKYRDTNDRDMNKEEKEA